MFVITTIVTTDGECGAAERVRGRSGVSGFVADGGSAFARSGAGAESGPAFGDAVQRAADSARVSGRAFVRGDREPDDHARSGYNKVARPDGEARADFALPGGKGPADGDGPDYARGVGDA